MINYDSKISDSLSDLSQYFSMGSSLCSELLATSCFASLCAPAQVMYKYKLDWELIRSSPRNGFGVLETLGFGD